MIRKVRGTRWALIPTVLGLAAALALSGCGSKDSNSKKDDPNAKLVVWTDATRQPAFEAYAKAHPNTKLDIQVVDQAGMLSKIQLANRVGKGWPDVVFDGSPNNAAAYASSLYKFALPLGKYVPKDVLDNFAGTAACEVNGQVVCLKNDIAQEVLWYDKPLMAQFGYSVPKTWDEYKALGEKVAKEHPGYLIGAEGDVNLWYDELWGSGCPLQDVVNDTQVKINTADSKCTRVADIFDPLLANGSVSRLSGSDPAVIKLATEGKMLMFPGPSWWGPFVMKAAYKIPNGHIAAAPVPTWSGDAESYVGAWGGGIFVASAHSANKAGAADVIQWVSTSDEVQTSAPTYPAYIPAAQKWLAAAAKDKWYAEDPSQVLVDMAAKINQGPKSTRYDASQAVLATVVAAIKSGGTIAASLPALQGQLAGLAQSVGYAVDAPAPK